MRGVVLAWAVGLGIFTWREVRDHRRPPVPGALLGASAVYAALAMIAEVPSAAKAAVLAAWAFDLAVYFQAGPSLLTGPASPPSAQHGKTSGPGQG